VKDKPWSYGVTKLAVREGEGRVIATVSELVTGFARRQAVEGFSMGYIGHNHRTSIMDEIVFGCMVEKGWDLETVYQWTNSHEGRHFGEWIGGCNPFRIAMACNQHFTDALKREAEGWATEDGLKGSEWIGVKVVIGNEDEVVEAETTSCILEDILGEGV